MDIVVDTVAYVQNHEPKDGVYKIEIEPTIIASDDKGNRDEIKGTAQEIAIYTTPTVFPPITVVEYRDTTFDANGGLFSNMNQQNVINKERTKTIEANEVEVPKREGYTFIEWNTQSDQSGDKLEFPYQVMNNKTYFAIWKREQAAVTEGRITVTYVDPEGHLLETTDTITGIVGESYRTTPKQIDGYTLSSIPKNAEGVFTLESIEVVYVYDKEPAGVTVEDIHNNIPKTSVVDSYYVPMFITGFSLLSLWHLLKKKTKKLLK